MAKVISLVPYTAEQVSTVSQQGQDTTGWLVDAAWKFAQSALWYEDNFPAGEIKAAKAHLRTYFQLSRDTEKAFIAFCERVLLANRYLAGSPSRYVDRPSIWLHRGCTYGFAGTRAWWERMMAQREKIKGYQEGVSVAARHYWSYIANPSDKVFTDCRKRLLTLREYGLLQIFYNAVIYLSFLK